MTQDLSITHGEHRGFPALLVTTPFSTAAVSLQGGPVLTIVVVWYLSCGRLAALIASISVAFFSLAEVRPAMCCTIRTFPGNCALFQLL